MRVNSVDNTNFRMALKLNPKKMPDKLKEMPMECIIRLNQLGDKIKDIKLYDVVFEDSLVPQVKSANTSITKDFFNEFQKEERLLGKAYEVPCGMAGETIGGFYPDEPKIFRDIYEKDASAQYKKFKKLSQIDQAGELSRLLEIRSIKQLLEQEKKKSEQGFNKIQEQAKGEQNRKAVNDLMDRYAAEEPVHPKKKWAFKFWGS